MAKTETWRKVVGYEGLYKVSNLGRVKSVPRKVRTASKGVETSRISPGKMMSFNKVGYNRGYRAIVLSKKGIVSKLYVHHLVLDAFIGPCPKGMECCHNDGNPSNNKLTNLRWDTPSSNNRDKANHGTDNRGSKHPMSILTEAYVLSIRKSNRSVTKIAKDYKVSHVTISNIILRKSWNHI